MQAISKRKQIRITCGRRRTTLTNSKTFTQTHESMRTPICCARVIMRTSIVRFRLEESQRYHRNHPAKPIRWREIERRQRWLQPNGERFRIRTMNSGANWSRRNVVEGAPGTLRTEHAKHQTDCDRNENPYSASANNVAKKTTTTLSSNDRPCDDSLCDNIQWTFKK